MKQTGIAILCAWIFCAVSFGQIVPASGVMLGEDVGGFNRFGGAVDSAEVGLVFWSAENTLTQDSLTYVTGNDTATYVSNDTMAIDGSSIWFIGEEILINDNYYTLIDTASTSDTLIFDESLTIDIGDTLYYGVSLIRDLSDSANHTEQATTTKRPRILYTGSNNAEIAFDGVDDILDFSSLILFDTVDMSLAYFMELSQPATNCWQFSGDQFGYEYIGPTGERFRVESNTNGDFWISEDFDKYDNSIHIVMITENDSCRWYVNGVETSREPTIDVLELLHIGMVINVNSIWPFKISDIRFYNRVISQNTINELAFGSTEVTGDTLQFITDITDNEVELNLDIVSGEVLKIEWGNGDVSYARGVGNYQTFSSDYTSNTTYIINVVGDLSKINKIRADYQEHLRGEPGLKQLTNATEIDFNDTYISFDIADLATMTDLVTIQLQHNDSLDGNISVLSNLVNCTSVQMGTSNVEGNISVASSMPSLVTFGMNTNPLVVGDINVIAGISALNYFQVGYGGVDDYTSTTLSDYGNVDFRFTDCGLTATEVDNLIIDLAAVPQTGIGILHLDGTNGTRTSASDAAKTTLEGLGWTINVNE